MIECNHTELVLLILLLNSFFNTYITLQYSCLTIIIIHLMHIYIYIYV